MPADDIAGLSGGVILLMGDDLDAPGDWPTVFSVCGDLLMAPYSPIATANESDIPKIVRSGGRALRSGIAKIPAIAATKPNINAEMLVKLNATLPPGR